MATTDATDNLSRGSGRRIYISDPEATAPASRLATQLLWLLLTVAALTVIFLP